MKIDRVIVFCSPNDVRLAELCVVSIRYWNKSVSIYLHKDESRRKFDTKHLERYFNVQLCDASKSSLGSPLSKLFYLLQGADLNPNGERLLILDADTAWHGDVLEFTSKFKEDLVVTGEAYSPSWSKKIAFDPEFYFETYQSHPNPRCTFNTGCFIANTRQFNMSDYSPFLENSNDKVQLSTAKIRLYDQGLINLVTANQIVRGEISCVNTDLMQWPGRKWQKKNMKQDAHVIHWAGLTHPVESCMPHYDLLRPHRIQFLKSKPWWPLQFVVHVGKEVTLYLFQQIRNLRFRILGKSEFIR